MTGLSPDGWSAAAVAAAAASWLSEHGDGVAELRLLTDVDSPSGEADRLAACAGRLREMLSALGDLSSVDCEGADHLVLRVGEGAGGPLLLCHYDTVWPAGTVATRPLRLDAGWAHGPGVLDMKGGIVVAVLALRALVALERVPSCGAVLSLTPDEERGNPGSRGSVERLARAACAALVLEPPLSDGRLKTRRKGIAHAIIEVEGEAAHAGVVSDGGVSAALEVARIALAASELAAPERGVSVNVGVLEAGVHRNVVAASGRLELDVRAHDAAELEAVLERLRSHAPAHARASIRVRGAVHRPPMEPDEGTRRLLAIAREAGAALGMAVGEGASGGASEANLAHAVGTPTLDGLGAFGHGAHAEDERIHVASLRERAALLAGIVVGAAGGKSANSRS